MTALRGLMGEIAVGVVVGLIASHLMDQFQRAYATLSRNRPDPDEEPATVKAADRLCLAVSGKPIPKPYRPAAGNAAHYGLGAALGGAYAVAARVTPAARLGAGMTYASAVWLGLDEGLLPALGLGKGWTAVPASKHAYGLISHLVFGLSPDGARCLANRAWPDSRDGAIR